MNSLSPLTISFLLIASFSTYACGSDSDKSATDAGAEEFDAQPPPDTCQFDREAQWLVEGESLETEIRCLSGQPLSDLEISDLPEGANLEGNRLRWTPGLDQAAVYELHLKSTEHSASEVLLIGVADNWAAPGNIPIVDKSRYTMELGLPVFFLEEEPESSDGFADQEILYRGKAFAAKAKLRGKSSLDYPKKSYALRFDSFDPFHEREFADFVNRRRVVLTSTFDDNSYIRQRLAYDLWSAFNPTMKVEAYNAVVYLGTQYHGLYTVSDHINSDLMKRSGLSDDGNLYKAESHDANFRLLANNGDDKENLHQGYSKTEGSPDEGEPQAFADLEELVQFVATASDADFNAQIDQKIEISEYIAWWVHVTFALAADTGGKNSYHYHDQARSWKVIPWDFNASFGQAWDTERTPSDEYEDFFRYNLLFERLHQHPSYGPMIAAQYKEALENGPLSADALTQQIDSYTEEIAAAAERDWQFWEERHKNFERWDYRDDFEDFQGEIAYLRQWLNERRDFVMENHTGEE